MKTNMHAALLVLSIAYFSGPTLAQEDKPAPAKPAQPTPAKPTPTPTDKPALKQPITPKPDQPPASQDADFKKLAALAGEWNATIKLRMDPNMDPFVSRAKVHNTLILDNHYLQSETTGEMQGRKIHTMAIFAYNTNARRFEQSWMDNRTTGINQLRGTFDSSTNAILFTGDIEDPATGKVVSDKAILKFVDDSTYVLEVHAKTPDGTEYVRMETTYRRARDATTDKPAEPTKPIQDDKGVPPPKK